MTRLVTADCRTVTPAMLYPVYGFLAPEPPLVASFFDYSSAVDFIQADERTLFVAEPIYDRRQHGYRYTPEPVSPSYREWLMDIELRRDGGRVAA